MPWAAEALRAALIPFILTTGGLLLVLLLALAVRRSGSVAGAAPVRAGRARGPRPRGAHAAGTPRPVACRSRRSPLVAPGAGRDGARADGRAVGCRRARDAPRRHVRRGSRHG